MPMTLQCRHGATESTPSSKSSFLSPLPTRKVLAISTAFIRWKDKRFDLILVITEIKFTTSEIIANAVWQWKRVREGFNIFSFHEILTILLSQSGVIYWPCFHYALCASAPTLEDFQVPAQFRGTSWDPIYNHCFRVTVYKAMHNTWTSYSQQH